MITSWRGCQSICMLIGTTCSLAPPNSTSYYNTVLVSLSRLIYLILIFSGSPCRISFYIWCKVPYLYMYNVYGAKYICIYGAKMVQGNPAASAFVSCCRTTARVICFIWEENKTHFTPLSGRSESIYIQCQGIYTQRIFFEFLLNHSEIRLYSPFSDWFGTTQTLVWFQIYRKMVNRIWFRVDLIRFGNDFPVCTLPALCMFAVLIIYLVSIYLSTHTQQYINTSHLLCTYRCVLCNGNGCIYICLYMYINIYVYTFVNVGSNLLLINVSLKERCIHICMFLFCKTLA